jgi:hypothetical protein
LVSRFVEERWSEVLVLWKARRLPCVMTVCENVVEIVSSASKRDTQMVRVQYSVGFLLGVAFSSHDLWNGGSGLCRL